MSTWMSCQECPCYFVPTSECYRRPDEVIHVDDPTVCPDWCPQEDSIRFPGNRFGKFPYHKETCEGCYYDADNTALVPPSCQGCRTRPLSEESGPCPYYVRSWKDEPSCHPISDDILPAVTRRFADLIVRGINDGDLSFWDIDTTMHHYGIGGTERTGCHRFLIKKDRRGGFRVCVDQTSMGHGSWVYRVELYVDHAEIVENYGYLFLYKGKNRYYNEGCVAIRIVDAEVDENTPDKEQECETVECPEPESVKHAPRLMSLEAFI